MPNWIVQLMAALVGTFSISVLFNVRGSKLLFTTLGGFFSWGVYLLTAHFTSLAYVSGLIASVAVTLYAEIMARCCKTPATVYLIAAAIPLFPGAALYRTMNATLMRDWTLAAQEGIYTLLFAASISAGITATTVTVRFIQHLLFRQRRL